LRLGARVTLTTVVVVGFVLAVMEWEFEGAGVVMVLLGPGPW